MKRVWLIGLLFALAFAAVKADDELDIDGTVEDDLGKSRDGSRTDDEVVQREEEAIQLDGLNAAQIKELREKSEKHAFQAEVNRMMKLIINSLYKNKEIFLRELISNASDALDKIRLLSLTSEDAMATNEELTIKIKSDKEKNMLHITDTGIGMTKEDLVKNLGTIAKSGTSEFLNKMTEMQMEGQSTSELIGQFGVGFYSAFLVADKVIVTSKHNNGTQHIWESDSNQFSVIEDPRGDTLGRGTTITLVLKEEASDYLELETIKNLVRKYSQFINFPIYVWASKTETVEEPIDEDAAAAEEPEKETAEDEAEVEEEEEHKDKPKTKKVEKTVWDWELMNDIKPIWQRPAKEVEEDEYKAFYKTFSKDSDDPLAHIHFTAEGEVTFKSILFVPNSAPRGLFDEYGSKKNDFIKLFVRRVFITDDFNDMMPKYLNFIKGVVDSDDLPLNVSRETLQQHKLLKIEKAVLSQRLTNSPCALVASQYGWSGNMERIMKAQAYQTGKDISTNYYASQKKTLEINPKHPLIKQMLNRINTNAEDQTASDLAVVLFETATLRSGYQLVDTKAYGDRIERMLRLSMNVPLDEQAIWSFVTALQIEEEPEEELEEPADDDSEDKDEIVDEGDDDE
ncbi:hypothetical protein INR49_017549, partial [Caranx melampygus]